MAESRLEPNAISCSAAISACEKGAQWPLALQLLDRMAESRAMPDGACQGRNQLLHEGTPRQLIRHVPARMAEP